MRDRSSDASSFVSFGVFRAHLSTGELWKSGTKVRLQDQPFRVLTALLGSPGELVTRERLKAELWPEETYVDFDRALTAYRSFERGRRYVLYCEIGMKSGHLAECMRREGLDAAHLGGGLRAAMRCANDLGASAATLNRDEEV